MNRNECQLTPNAIQVLESRYLLKNERGEIIETSEQMFRRVADTISDNKKLADKIYKLMCETKFLGNSPLFNAGTLVKNYSACFALSLHDSMESIFQTIKIAALIFQSGGGCGFDFSEIRPVGSPVKSTQGIASGVISFANVYNAAIETIKQGGKRRGAAIGLLSISHPEVIKWIHVKDEGQTLSNFNLSVIITAQFMNAVKNDLQWNLEFKGKIYQTIPAKELFNMICVHAHKTGDPGIVFMDNINKFNCHKHIGLIHNTNPCGEISIFTGVSPFNFSELNISEGDDIAESCNLGSFDVSKYVDNGKMNWNSLANDIPFAIRFLDCIPDKNEYATPVIEKGTKLLRKIGLGLMGFADALAKLNISYNSREAIEFGEHLMEFINYHSTKASIELAKEKGSFPAFKGSSWDTGEVWSFKNTTDRFDWKELKADIAKYGIRNCNVNAIAPTGTLSIIAGCSSAIEPIFGVVYEKHIALGVLYESNPIFKDMMLKRGIYTKEIESKCSKHASIQSIKEIPDDIKKLFLTSHDVPYQQHIAIQVAFQKFTDINISKTINMPNNATIDDVIAAYTLASESCKGITIYRDGSKDEQVLVAGNLKNAPTPRHRYQDHIGIIREIMTGCGVYYNIIDFDQYGLFENFQINSGKGGCDGSQKASGRMISTGLRNNISPEVYIKQLHRVHCESCTTKKNGGIEYECDSCGERFNTKKKALQCPSCGSQNITRKNTKQNISVLSCADGVAQHMKDYITSPEVMKEILKLQKLVHTKFNETKDIQLSDSLLSDSRGIKQIEERKKCPECGSTEVEDTNCGTCRSCGYTRCI